MELQKLKTKLRIAVKCHKLLKDKFDQMMRQFRVLIKENKKLRIHAEEQIGFALSNFLVARTQLFSQQIENELAMPAIKFEITTDTTNIMGLDAPKLTCTQISAHPKTYSNASLGTAVTTLEKEFVKLIKLAEVEKTCEILANEIEKSRRRINALEHIFIPQINETIKYITMKLGENERQNITRLMKVKQFYGE